MTLKNTSIVILAVLLSVSCAEEMYFNYNLGASANICFNENIAENIQSNLRDNPG